MTATINTFIKKRSKAVEAFFFLLHKSFFLFFYQITRDLKQKANLERMDTSKLAGY